MAKTCAICGKPSGMYPLCPACFKLRDAGEVLKCDSCGVWHRKGEPCQCKTPEPVEQLQKKSAEPIKESAATSSDELTCILCGEPSNGKHFCISCYHKYKDKVVLLKIHKCEFPTGEPLDESYEGVYECEDGHIVKSISEQVIDDWLCDKGIFHGYEIPLDIGENKPLKPDFYLKNYLGPGKDVYIEYFGLKGQPKYDESTAYKMGHYKRLGITLICLYPREARNLKFALQTKLNKDKIKEGQINYEE